MFPYWIMFCAPALAGVFEGVRKPEHGGPAWFLAWVSLTLLVGFRFNVGGDWGSYLSILLSLLEQPLSAALDRGDYGYYILNWLSLQFGWDIYGVNLVCAAIFAWGLIAFCREQPRPWLALTVAVPYLVIVVAMGYTRQGTAIGLSLLGLRALGRNGLLKFFGWICLAALFHKSAIILVAFALLAGKKNFWTITGIGVSFLAIYLSMGDTSDDLLGSYNNYINVEVQSSGATIRVLMNAVPAALLLLFRRRFGLTPQEKTLWTYFAIAALALGLVLWLTPYSTAVDRIALYLIPLQLFVFARLPNFLLGQDGHSAVTAGILLYYGAVLATWLLLADNSHAWLPYRSLLLEV